MPVVDSLSLALASSRTWAMKATELDCQRRATRRDLGSHLPVNTPPGRADRGGHSDQAIDRQCLVSEEAVSANMGTQSSTLVESCTAGRPSRALALRLEVDNSGSEKRLDQPCLRADERRRKREGSEAHMLAGRAMGARVPANKRT